MSRKVHGLVKTIDSPDSSVPNHYRELNVDKIKENFMKYITKIKRDESTYKPPPLEIPRERSFRVVDMPQYSTRETSMKRYERLLDNS